MREAVPIYIIAIVKNIKYVTALFIQAPLTGF